MNFTNKI